MVSGWGWVLVHISRRAPTARWEASVRLTVFITAVERDSPAVTRVKCRGLVPHLWVGLCFDSPPTCSPEDPVAVITASLGRRSLFMASGSEGEVHFKTL